MIKKYINFFKKPMIYITISTLIAGNSLLAVPASALGGFDLKSDIIINPINEYQVDIAPGVGEKHYSFENTEGKRIEAFIVDIDMDNPQVSIEAGTPNGGDVIGKQTVREQAQFESMNGHRVVAAVNGDYFNMATGEPFGIVYKDGRAVIPDQFSTWRFFAITKDKKAVIGDASYYKQIKDTIKEAIGGQAILVKDGKPFEIPPYNIGRNPRTAVGIKGDGDVFFIAVDGRQQPYSSGITAAELAQLMIDLGAVTALDLDGGGSTTFLSRRPGEYDLQLVNSPSDGVERKVANSLLVVSTALSDQIFNSAFIEPYDISITPGTVVQFSGKGRDKSMAPAPLPSYGLSWELSDMSFGSIDMNGRFLSSGKTGEVQILLKQYGNVVGKTWIEVRDPDEMKFESTQLRVIKGSIKPLNLITRYSKRDLSWKYQDIEWTIPSGLGTIDNNGVLHASQNPVPGKITAKYKNNSLSAEIDVVVVNPPETIIGFEDGLGSWVSSVVGRGENASIDISSYPYGPVRFGNKSMKIDFDFTNGQKQAVLGTYAGPGIKTPIPGNPSSIGMWIYATPEAKGYWLRMAIIDGNGNTQNIDLTPSSPGIDWTGWKYVEASIPSTFAMPLFLHPEQTIRIMSSNSGVTGPMTKGSIYIDNIRAVYGEKADDLYPPVIESINVENKVYNSHYVDINAKVSDNEKDYYKSGINWDKVKILLDGVDYTGKKGSYYYDKSGFVSFNGLYFTNGSHSVTVIAEDNFGNQTQKTVYFLVKAS